MRKITLPTFILAFLATIAFGSPKSVTLDDFSLEDNQPSFTSKVSITNHVSFNPNYRRIAAAVCQDITVYLDGTGSASIVPADIDNGSVGDGFSLDISSFSCADIGSPVTVTLTVTDSSDTTSDSCTAQVTVLDTTLPTISLNGPNPQTIEACSAYSELGAITNDNCSGIGGLVIDASAVNTSVVGSYSVTYDVADASGNNAVQVTRTVNVVDTTVPTITLNGSATVTVEACGTYNELGATADDGCLAIGAVVIDNSSVDETTVGSYTVTYNVSDAAGNSAVQVTRTVNVVDTTVPTITLNGLSTVTVEACGTYNELGATADD
ncbi:hyalin, partial [Hanstruepera neustonica]